MVYYLNLGFILEQALVDVIKTYIDRLQLDDVYRNYHISVTNEHPFAHMIVDQNSRCSDNFPAIVITTDTDNKVPDLNNMPPQFSAIGLTSEDIDSLINSTKRNKTRINNNGEVIPIVKNGIIQKEKIPGYIFVFDEKTINTIKQIADENDSKEVYALKIATRRRDKISFEIWAENEQLKNELYEHLRLLLATSLEKVMQDRYKMLNIAVFDHTLSGNRSSNYNFDFDVMLCGSHMSIDIDYDIQQIIIDTDVKELSYDLIAEVINHVKE